MRVPLLKISLRPGHVRPANRRFASSRALLVGVKVTKVTANGASTSRIAEVHKDAVAHAPLGDFGPLNYNSSSLNQNEHDTYIVNIATLQKKGTDGDAQFAVYSRYAKINFIPDVFGDLVFNDVAQT